MFGNNLKKLRFSRGMTQSVLAEHLGVSTSTIGMYEQNRRKPDPDMLKKISALFNISVDKLLETALPTKYVDKDITEVIDDITFTLRSQKGLMFNGKPVTLKDREKIANAIKIAAAIAVSGSRLDKQ